MHKDFRLTEIGVYKRKCTEHFKDVAVSNFTNIKLCLGQRGSLDICIIYLDIYIDGYIYI